MIREHKYRYWDNGLKRMIYDTDLCSNPSHYSLLSDNQRFEPLECTGVKDTTRWSELTKQEQEDCLLNNRSKYNWRGKEIYEKDLIKDSKGLISEVVFKDGVFGFWSVDTYYIKGLRRRDFYFMPLVVDRAFNSSFMKKLKNEEKLVIKIVGNSYENLDLVQSQNVTRHQ
jgi:hypothetical protein